MDSSSAVPPALTARALALGARLGPVCSLRDALDLDRHARGEGDREALAVVGSERPCRPGGRVALEVEAIAARLRELTEVGR